MPVVWSENAGSMVDNTYSHFRVEAVSPRTETQKRPPAKPPMGSRQTKATPAGVQAIGAMRSSGRSPRDLNTSGSYSAPERSAALGPFGRAMVRRTGGSTPSPTQATPATGAGMARRTTPAAVRPRATTPPTSERSEGVAAGTKADQYSKALQRRQGGHTGTASMNPAVLRDRAARLRARMAASGSGAASAGVGWSAGRGAAYGP